MLIIVVIRHSVVKLQPMILLINHFVVVYVYIAQYTKLYI